jgi:hypothetical protein
MLQSYTLLLSLAGTYLLRYMATLLKTELNIGQSPNIENNQLMALPTYVPNFEDRGIKLARLSHDGAIPGLPDFRWCNIPKWEKMHQTTTKNTNAPFKMPCNYKIYQMVVKCTNIFISKAIQNLTKLLFMVWKCNIWQPWAIPVTPKPFKEFVKIKQKKKRFLNEQKEKKKNQSRIL